MLDEAARARLCGPFVSGTGPPPGRADADDGLVDLVDEFYNGDDCKDGGVVAKDARAPRSFDCKEKVRAILADAAADVAAARIRAEAERVVRDAAGVDGRKRLMERLRAKGLDAGNNQLRWHYSF